MKNIYILIASVLIFSALQIPSTQALSCAPSLPTVSTIEAIKVQEDGSHLLSLKWVYSFKETRVNPLSVIDLDAYSKIVDEYNNDDLDLLEKVEANKNIWRFDQFILSAEEADLLDAQVDDILLLGPPRYICGFGFTGVFNERGVLRKALIKDDFRSYSYANFPIEISKGSDILCQGYSCSVKIDFRLDKDKVSLVPGQLYQPQSGPITSIKIINAQFPEEGADAEKLFPWGGGKQANYVLGFNPNIDIDFTLEKAGELKEQREEEEQAKQDQETAPVDRELEFRDLDQDSEEAKRENIFLSIWNWLKSLFS